MSERKMYNFPFMEDGQTYWRSRSCTVVGYVYCANKEGYLCVLANQRGPGAPTNVGKWNVPCGYIGFIEECGDVDGNHAVIRETYEETGVKLKPEQFNFDSVSFSKDGDENINLRYWAKLAGTIDDYPLSNAANEEGETSDIRWIRLCDVKNYDWAFGHEKSILTMANHIEYTVDNDGIQTVTPYLVQISETTKSLNEEQKIKRTDYIPVMLCDTIDKCKEYTKKRMVKDISIKEESGFKLMNRDYMQKILDDNLWNYGVCLHFSKAGEDGVVTEHKLFSYLFTPIEKYE